MSINDLMETVLMVLGDQTVCIRKILSTMLLTNYGMFCVSADYLTELALGAEDTLCS